MCIEQDVEMDTRDGEVQRMSVASIISPVIGTKIPVRSSAVSHFAQTYHRKIDKKLTNMKACLHKFAEMK